MEDEWKGQNSLTFPSWIVKKLADFNIKKNAEMLERLRKGEKMALATYQMFIREYMQHYRGLLVYHGLGSGKTLSAIAAAESFPDMVKVVMAPSILKEEFKREIQKWSGQEFDKEKWVFLSTNAPNFAEQVSKLEGTLEKQARKGQRAKRRKSKNVAIEEEILSRKNPLDGKFIIIDEVHNLTASIINPTAINADKVYDLIMDAKDVKLLFLSGTPILGDVFSIAPLFNMLRGKMYVEGRKDEYYTAFPESFSDFEKYFISWKTNRMINKHIFQERITGLVSYYRGIQDEELMPKMLPLKLVKCEMSPFQWRIYSAWRLKEIREEQITMLRKDKFIEQRNKKAFRESSSTFKQKTRLASNFAPPEAITKPKFKFGEDRKVIEDTMKRLLEQLSEKELARDKVGKYSTKYKALLEEVESEKNGIVQVYSEFVSFEGLAILGKMFGLNGWTEVDMKDLLVGQGSDAPQGKGNGEENPEKLEGGGRKSKGGMPGEDYKRFIVISGEVDQKDRSKLLHQLNDVKENLRGKRIRMILMSMVGAEGLNLKGVRKTIAMEPYWHWSKIEQIFARARRQGSHIHLPPGERNVQPILYLASPPAGTSPKKELDDFDDMTTDEHIYEKSIKRWELIQDFLGAIRETAVDCDLNYDDNKSELPRGTCRKCQEVSDKIKETKQMWEPNIGKHMIPGNSFCYPREKRLVQEGEKWVDVDTGKEYKKEGEDWIPVEDEEEED